jgi:hypothetical protein
MRSIRFLLVTGALLLPTMAFAQGTTILGTSGNLTCSGPVTDPGELYATKFTNSGSAERDDILYDLRAKGGGQAEVGPAGPQYNGGTWIIPPNWKQAQAATDVHFVIVTYPPLGPGQPGRFTIDSATQVLFDAGIVKFQEVGNSIPVGNLNSVGLTISGSSTPFTVNVRPATPKTFPAGTTSNGINVAFAPAIDVNDSDPGGTGCTWGAANPDPLDTTDVPARRGAIIGYNVYRVPGTAGNVPSPTDFKNALTDADQSNGWVGFVDMRTLHMATPDGNPPAEGTPSPVEVSSATDIAGIQNPNGIAYDADEVVIFQDSPNSTRSRPGGTVLEPSITQTYWYAIQPVIDGTVAEFDSAGWTPNDRLLGDHSCDMDGDGLADSIDLDTIDCTGIATIDFISPQAEHGIDGLGLTNNSLPLLSAPQFFDANPASLPATGGISVVATVSGSDVSLQLTTGLEGRSIAGYNVYRQVGEQRVRVNEQPILAQGAESNVYSLLDTAVSSARVARATSVQYMVETVYSDGTPSTFAGPFTVEIQPQQPARRRR